MPQKRNLAVTKLRHLVVVLGDQLDAASPVFDGFDCAQDRVWMCEAPSEATYAWSHKARIAIFLAAMRHFRDQQRGLGRPLDYHATGAHPHASLADALTATLAEIDVARVIVVEPGEWRLLGDFERVCAVADVPLTIREDRHFLCPREDFTGWMDRRKQPRMEHFYHWMRQREDVLMREGQPEGGRWNYDADNRRSFDARGPGFVPKPASFPPDAITREVLALVAIKYAAHPGALESFDWPVTRAEALVALDDFIAQRLPAFGSYQDALWDAEPLLYHARLSSSLNLKLLHPREVIDAALHAYTEGRAPLASVEGFVRQILGWREFVRGLYWHHMPQYLDDNALGAEQPLPAFYWTGDTTMNCLRITVGDTLRHAYAHHIQRLMVTGLFALLLAVRPREVHGWYLAVYVDAVEWAEAPNTIGMSQFADGGLMGSKPYVASGKYIDRMSNYCKGCAFDPARAVGETACPYTTLYWDFLDRHQRRFAAHPRLKLQVANLLRKSETERAAIREQAEAWRQRLATTPASADADATKSKVKP